MSDLNDSIREQTEKNAIILRERVADLERELAEARGQLKSIETLLRSLEPSSKEWRGSVDDVRGCENIRQALVKLALLNEGILRPSPATKILIAAGLTESTVPSRVTPGVYARLKTWRDWQHTGRGEFTYLGGEESL